MKRHKFRQPPVVEVRRSRSVAAAPEARRAMPDGRVRAWHDDALQRQQDADLGPKLRPWDDYEQAMSSGQARLLDDERLQYQEAHRRQLDRANDTSIYDRDSQMASDVYVINKYAEHAKEIVDEVLSTRDPRISSFRSKIWYQQYRYAIRYGALRPRGDEE